MAQPAVKAAELVQIGKEGTRGSLVTATRRLIGDCRFSIEQEHRDFADRQYGNLARTSRAPVITQNRTAFSIRSDLDAEQILVALLSGVKGGVTGSGGGADKTWTFTPGIGADPAPDTYTIEFTEENFSDVKEYEAGYGFCTDFEVSWGIDGVPELTINMVARKAAESTKTASIAVPSLNPTAALQTSVYVDDSWANLGNTQISNQIYGARAAYTTGITMQFYLDGRADLDFTQYVFDKRSLDLTMDVEVDPSASGFVILEKADKDAGTMRFVRVEIIGAALGGSNYTVRIDGAYYHAPDSMVERGSDRDGHNQVSVHLMSAHDSSQDQDVAFVVINALTSFPS